MLPGGVVVYADPALLLSDPESCLDYGVQSQTTAPGDYSTTNRVFPVVPGEQKENLWLHYYGVCYLTNNIFINNIIRV